jgi:hypothetical protein
MPPRRIPRSIYEEARNVARAPAKTKAFEQSRRDRKRVERLFAHLKRLLRLGRWNHSPIGWHTPVRVKSWSLPPLWSFQRAQRSWMKRVGHFGGNL